MALFNIHQCDICNRRTGLNLCASCGAYLCDACSRPTLIEDCRVCVPGCTRINKQKYALSLCNEFIYFCDRNNIDRDDMYELASMQKFVCVDSNNVQQDMFYKE